MGLKESNQTKFAAHPLELELFYTIINEFLLSGLKQLLTWDSPLYRKRVVNFAKNIVFLYLELFFTIANSVDPDEMQHGVAFQFSIWVFSVCKS